MEPQKTPESPDSQPLNTNPSVLPPASPAPTESTNSAPATTPLPPITNEAGASPMPSSDVMPAATGSGPMISGDMPGGAMPLGAAPKRSKKGLVLGAIIAGVVFVLLGGAAAAYYYVASTKPENVLLKALANSLDEDKAKTMHISGAMNVTSKEDADMSLKGTYTGAFNDETSAMDISAKLDVFVTNATFDLRSVDGKTVYVKLGGLNGLPQLLNGLNPEAATAYTPLISAINDQWFEINESLITKAFDGPLNQRLSTADRQKVAKAYQDNPFLVVKEKLADEKIKGVNSYHYKVTIDKTKLKAFVSAMQQLESKSFKPTSEELKDFNDAIKNVQFDKAPFDLWIGKSNKMLTQFAVKTTQDNTDIEFTMTVDDYNKPVTVEKPEGAKSILDVLGNFIGAMNMGGGSLQSGLPGLESSSDSGVSL